LPALSLKEVRVEIAYDVASIVKTCMEAAFSRLNPNAPIEVKPEFRNSWN
jgi:hypothetical protein